MRIRFWRWLIAVAAALPAHAQSLSPAAVTLRVEQPAYTGMPVWLHVIVRDECMEDGKQASPWRVYLWLRDDGPEVTRGGHPVPRTPFTNGDPNHGLRMPGLAACLRQAPPGQDQDHRFALSGAYVFDQAGDYQVRLMAGLPDFHGNWPAAQSGWFGFTVQQSTPEQRKAWLDGMLSKDFLLPAPGPQDNIVTDYIPALLAAWPDPRVTRRLIDIACSGMKDTNIAAGAALQYDLPPAVAAYFAEKIACGCHWGGMASFVLRHAQELTAVRTALLHGLAAHFDERHPDGAELEDAIFAMATLRNDVPAGADGGAANAWADTDIVRVSQVLTDPHDEDGMPYTQGSTGGLVTYLSHKDLTPAEHALLRSMAMNDLFGLAPFERLLSLEDPADLAFLGKKLAKLQGIRVWGNYFTDMDALTQRFGTRAAPMLRIVASTGQDYALRDRAAFDLMTIGQDGGEGVLDRSARSDYWVERRGALRILDQLAGDHVSLGTLAHYCTGPDDSDPCGASEIKTPPGKCEPHFSCRVYPPVPK